MEKNSEDGNKYIPPHKRKECRQCGKAPVQKNSSYSAPEKSVYYVPKEKQTQLILAWNIIEQSAVTKKIDAFLTETNKQINSADIKDLRNTIIHLPENGCLCISDAVDFLTACSSESKAAMCFNILTSLEYVELKNKCGVVEDDMPYLFFIQVLGACREILSFRLREDKHPLESPQAMKKTNKEGVYEAKAMINDKVIIWQQVTKSKIDHPWTLFLEESGLKVSKIAENIKKDLNIDLHERIARNLFRNCVCYELCCSKCKEPVLDDHERREFIAYANESPSIDECVKKYLATMLQSCNAQKTKGVFGDETKTDENISHIVTTIEKLITARPLDNLVHLLYTLNTEVLKQRKNRSCKEKAQNMKVILNAVPELLEFPKILGLEAKDFKDLDSIYNESMDQLFKQFFSSFTTSNLVTGVLLQEDNPLFNASSNNLENEYSYNVGNGNSNVARSNQETEATPFVVDGQELLDQVVIRDDMAETPNYLDYAIRNNNNNNNS